MSIPKEDERTPGPWYVGAQNDAPYIINQPPRPSTDDITKGPADLVVVARVYKLGDAEDIVRACNSYDKLREALAALVGDVLDYERTNGLYPNPGRKFCWQSTENACALLQSLGVEVLPISGDVEARAALNATQPATGVEKLSTDEVDLK